MKKPQFSVRVAFAILTAFCCYFAGYGSAYLAAEAKAQLKLRKQLIATQQMQANALAAQAQAKAITRSEQPPYSIRAGIRSVGRPDELKGAVDAMLANQAGAIEVDPSSIPPEMVDEMVAAAYRDGIIPEGATDVRVKIDGAYAVSGTTGSIAADVVHWSDFNVTEVAGIESDE